MMLYSKRINKAKLALLAMQRHSWEQGVAMQAFLELGEGEVVVALAKEAAYRKAEDGRVAAIGTMEAVTDPCAAGEGLLWAYQKTGDRQLKEAYQNLIIWALEKAPRNKDGILYHLTDAKEFWVDSMYMLPPFLAAAGYYDEALKQLYGYWDKLFIPEKKLMAHMWEDGKGAFKRRDCWGVGNGWTMAGLVRVIDLLPAEKEKEKEKLIQMAVDLIKTVSGYIREDGLAHDVLDDPDSFVEVNLPQMLSYSIYRGVNAGWLVPGWLRLADKCRKTAEKKMDEYGLIQGVCGAPHFISPGVAPEGQAFYLMMEAAAMASNATKDERSGEN